VLSENNRSEEEEEEDEDEKEEEEEMTRSIRREIGRNAFGVP